MSLKLQPAPLHVQIGSYIDMEQQAAQLSGHDQIYRQLSRGAFSGRFTTAESPDGAGLYVETVNQTIEQFGHVPRDQVSLLFLVGPQPGARLGQRSFETGQMMLAGPGTEIEFQTAPGTEVCVLTCRADTLAPFASARGAALPATGETRGLDNPAAARMLGAAVQALVGGAMFAAGLCGEAFTAEIGGILAGVAGLASQAGAELRRPASSRADLFRQARSLIHEMPDAASVATLKRRLHVSRRTLEYAFQDAAGMSPHTYIAAVRLNAIRRAIKETDDSIGDIAARFGIWHMGRLAAQYRETFGHLPSQARQKG